MTDRNDKRADAAIAWLLRLRNGSSEAWVEFTAWLEADPRHRIAYEEVEQMDLVLDKLTMPKPQATQRDYEVWSANGLTRRALVGWGTAAAIAASVAAVATWPRQRLYEVQTAAGERRTVKLADGSRIELNGATRLLLDRRTARLAMIAEGEAYFRIARDAAHPFTLDAGNAQVRVLGTAFNLIRSGGEVDVAVSEGAISLDLPGRSTTLKTGMSARSADGVVTVSKTSIEEIGSWRERRLVYSSASYTRIAADLSRNSGVKLRAAGDVADRRFSGVIMVPRDSRELVQRVPPLLGVEARRSGEEWVLTSSRAPL